MSEPIETEMRPHSGSEVYERKSVRLPDLRVLVPNDGREMVIHHVGYLSVGVFPLAEEEDTGNIAIMVGDPGKGEGMMVLLNAAEAMAHGLSLQRLASSEYRAKIASEADAEEA